MRLVKQGTESGSAVGSRTGTQPREGLTAHSTAWRSRGNAGQRQQER